jgi:rhodanese-related sulfurtransferase
MQGLEVDVGELRDWRDAERDLALLDVREPGEHAVASLAGARLIPLRELPHRLRELDPGRPLVVFCHHGMRSLQAVHLLRARGFPRAVSLRGGIDAWSRRVDPGVPRY